MKRVLLLLGCMCLCVLAALPQVQNKVEVYPAPSGEEMKIVLGLTSTQFLYNTRALDDLVPPTKKTMSFARAKS